MADIARVVFELHKGGLKHMLTLERPILDYHEQQYIVEYMQKEKCIFNIAT